VAPKGKCVGKDSASIGQVVVAVMAVTGRICFECRSRFPFDMQIAPDRATINSAGVSDSPRISRGCRSAAFGDDQAMACFPLVRRHGSHDRFSPGGRTNAGHTVE
jgi:hypothetical protein